MRHYQTIPLNIANAEFIPELRAQLFPPHLQYYVTK
jgi:hypothetical protein